MPLPTGVVTSVVTGTFTEIIGGVATAVDGMTVSFTPSTLVLTDPTASTTVMLESVQGLVVAGVLKDLTGATGVTLVATDQSGLTPVNFTWTVQFFGGPSSLTSFSFLLPGGVTKDMSTLIPITASPGVSPGGGGTGPVNPATTSSLGTIQLAGALGGTATSPTVPGLATKQKLIRSYPTQAAAQLGLANGEFADGDIIMIGP